MISIVGRVGENKVKEISLLPEDVFDPALYPPLTKYYSEDKSGVTFGIIVRGKELPELSLVAENDLLIAADADIYNSEELKGKLGIHKDLVFTSAAIILKSFKRWGKDCVKHIHGDFAFSIWNTESGELFCARDPIGARPFYYADFPGIFIFSSELRTLLKLFPGQTIINQEYFNDTLVTQISDKHITAFHSIFRLPPAHYLIHKKGRISLTNYWIPDLNRTIKLCDRLDYSAMMKEQIHHAVKTRLQNARGIGAELSGGIDSSFLTSLAYDECTTMKIPFYTFSNILPSEAGNQFKDELPFIQQVIDSRKIGGIFISETNEPILQILRHQLDIHGSFIQQRFGMFNKELYKTASAHGATVLLSGFGGDEMVSSRMSTPWNDMLADGNWVSFVNHLFSQRNPLKALVRAVGLPLRYIFWDYGSSIHAPGVINPEMLATRFMSLCLNQQYAEKYQLKKLFFGKYIRPSQKYLSQRQFQRFNRPHVAQRLEYCYEAAGFYNVQYRYPLLDTRVIESYLSIPPLIRYGTDGNRNIFRMAMQGIVPEEIRLRNDKSGSTIPYIQIKLQEERNSILSFVNECSKNDYLKTIFDFSKFPAWYEKLIKRDEKDIQFLMPGAFYNYLMIMMYFKSLESGT